MKTFTLVSCNGNKTVKCNCVTEAIAKAVAMEAKLPPSCGVTVKDADGEMVTHIVDGQDYRDIEIEGYGTGIDCDGRAL